MRPGRRPRLWPGSLSRCLEPLRWGFCRKAFGSSGAAHPGLPRAAGSPGGGRDLLALGRSEPERRGAETVRLAALEAEEKAVLQEVLSLERREPAGRRREEPLPPKAAPPKSRAPRPRR